MAKLSATVVVAALLLLAASALANNDDKCALEFSAPCEQVCASLQAAPAPPLAAGHPQGSCPSPAPSALPWPPSGPRAMLQCWQSPQDAW